MYAASGKSITTAADNTLTVKLVAQNAANGDTDAVAYDASQGMLVAGNGDSKAGYALYTFSDDLAAMAVRVMTRVLPLGLHCLRRVIQP